MQSLMGKHPEIAASESMGLSPNIGPMARMMDGNIEKIQTDGTLTTDAKTLKSFETGAAYLTKIETTLAEDLERITGQSRALEDTLYSSKLRAVEMNPMQVAVLSQVLDGYKADEPLPSNEKHLRSLLELEDMGMINGVSKRADAIKSGDVLTQISRKGEEIANASLMLQNLGNYKTFDLQSGKAEGIKERQV